MFSSFLSMTVSFFSKAGALLLNLFASMGTYKCVFSWGMVGICALVFLYFLLRGKFKFAIAVFFLLGSSTYIYDFVGCNDCGNKLPLSRHFGAACPAESSEPAPENNSGESSPAAASEGTEDSKNAANAADENPENAAKAQPSSANSQKSK